MPTKPLPDASPRDLLAGAGRVAIVAGGGLLPVDLAKGLDAAGKPPFVIIVKGEVEDVAAFSRYSHEFVDIEQAGILPKLLKREAITHVVLAGNIGRRPNPLAIRPVLPLLRFLPKFLAALARGDDALLRTLIAYIESSGARVVGAHEILPDLLVPLGVHTRVKPGASDLKDIQAAFAAARAIGELDIGQAAVAIGGRAVALEGIEATDGLLARVADLRSHGRLAGRKGGVLVKCCKPGQELRADLPSIGVQTVEAAHRAGLAGIAVEADHSFGLGFKDLLQRADALGLFVVGLTSEGKLP